MRIKGIRQCIEEFSPEEDNQGNRCFDKSISRELAYGYKSMAEPMLQEGHGQIIGDTKRLVNELRVLHNISELDAINIVQGRNIQDIVNKYERNQRE